MLKPPVRVLTAPLYQYACGLSLQKEIAPADSKISDLTRGKLINDVAELDLTNEVPLGAGASGSFMQPQRLPTTDQPCILSCLETNLGDGT